MTEKAKIMDAEEIRRALMRIANQMCRTQQGCWGLVIVGIHRRGVPLAKRLAEAFLS